MYMRAKCGFRINKLSYIIPLETDSLLNDDIMALLMSYNLKAYISDAPHAYQKIQSCRFSIFEGSVFTDYLESLLLCGVGKTSSRASI